MRTSELKSSASAFVICVALAIASPALSQATAPANDETTGGLDEIVVTASGGDKTKLKSSISVSSVSNEEILNFTPRSEAEVLRSIPGLNLQDTAGPGGNANIGVRGIPVSTGGSEYVALQEDGLPVTLFGDIQFGNNDYWIRFDNNVERVEAVRGGSSSTFASQAPGAVINYISKTGTKEGGEIRINEGVNFRETRLDFDYGGPISETLRFHIGGFLKDGNGPNHIGFKASSGYQIKGNITKEFADNKGFIRLNFKRLDDREPTNTSQPSLVTLATSGGVTRITKFSTFDGVDARRYSSAGIYNQTFQILNANGTLERVKNEGIHPKVTSFGGEFHYEFGDAITVDNNFRYTNASGAFGNQWTGEALRTGLIGQTIGDINLSLVRNAAGVPTSTTGGISLADATRTVGSIRYSAGPRAGQEYTDTYINGDINSSAQVYTRIKDIGSLANDFKVNAKFEVGADSQINARLGWFHFRQTIAADWRINHTISSLNSSGDSVPLDLFTAPGAAGVQLTANGVTGFNNQWGGCCGGRVYDVDYTDDAPYLNLDGTFGDLNLEASVRYDSVKASGQSFNRIGDTGSSIRINDGLGSVVVPTFNTTSAVVDNIDYTRHYTSWSIGGLYSLSDNASLFARASRGGRFNADRLLYSGLFNADGSLNAGGRNNSVNFVTQQEVGVKARGEIGGGRYNFETTVFRAGVKEHNYDFSAPSRGQSPFIDAVFKSYGVEADGNLRFGGFAIDGSVVYTHSRIKGTSRTPHTLPKITYRLSPSYNIERGSIGFSLDGQTSAFADDGNTLKIPGATFVNAFAKLRPYDGFELGINVNNLFNTLGYRGSGGLAARTSATTALFDNSAVTGRTITASVGYRF